MAIRNQRHQLTDEERSSCCSWECVTKVFAWFSLALNIAGALAWITIIATTLIGILGPEVLLTHRKDNVIETAPISRFTMVLASAAFLTIFSVSLIFNGFLCNGVNNKEPEHVFIYFVYGVAVECLSVMVCAWLATLFGFVAWIASYAVCCICYPFFLVAVWKTYKKYNQVKDTAHTQELLDHK